MKNIVFTIVFLTIFPTTAFSNSQNSDKTTQEFAYESLTKVILHSLNLSLGGRSKETVVDPSGLILLLASDKSIEARNLLLQLLELNIGPVHAEALSYAVVKQGKAIEDDLRNLLREPVECTLLKNDRFEALQCLSQEARDAHVRWLLKLIENGKTIEYVP